MIPLPPETVILEEMKAIAVAEPLHVLFGLAADPIAIRHQRHRNAAKSERPGIALRYRMSEVDNERQPFHTSSEQCWAMTVDIIVDLRLLPEKPADVAAGDDNDATGWDRLLGVARYLSGRYVRQVSPLRMLVDDVLHGDVDPDEDSQPDEGRLAAAVIVLYRTYSEDPLHLLGPGDNA